MDTPDITQGSYALQLPKLYQETNFHDLLETSFEGLDHGEKYQARNKLAMMRLRELVRKDELDEPKKKHLEHYLIQIINDKTSPRRKQNYAQVMKALYDTQNGDYEEAASTLEKLFNKLRKENQTGKQNHTFELAIIGPMRANSGLELGRFHAKQAYELLIAKKEEKERKNGSTASPMKLLAKLDLARILYEGGPGIDPDERFRAHLLCQQVIDEITANDSIELKRTHDLHILVTRAERMKQAYMPPTPLPDPTTASQIETDSKSVNSCLLV